MIIKRASFKVDLLEKILMLFMTLFIVLKKKPYPWHLLLIDFEKAFDSFSWKFMYKVLEFFTFGPDLIKWVSVYIMKPSSVSYKMVVFLSFFSIGKGCRQGDQVSP